MTVFHIEWFCSLLWDRQMFLKGVCKGKIWYFCILFLIVIFFCDHIFHVVQESQMK